MPAAASYNAKKPKSVNNAAAKLQCVFFEKPINATPKRQRISHAQSKSSNARWRPFGFSASISSTSPAAAGPRENRCEWRLVRDPRIRVRPLGIPWRQPPNSRRTVGRSTTHPLSTTPGISETIRQKSRASSHLTNSTGSWSRHRIISSWSRSTCTRLHKKGFRLCLSSWLGTQLCR